MGIDQKSDLAELDLMFAQIEEAVRKYVGNDIETEITTEKESGSDRQKLTIRIGYISELDILFLDG